MTATDNARSRLSPGVIVLLVIVTVANVSALLLAVSAWTGETTYGGRQILSVLLALVALAGITGAWLQRSWGPSLYLAVQALGFVVLLFAAPAAIGVFTFVPLVLAGLLWFLTR